MKDRRFATQSLAWASPWDSCPGLVVRPEEGDGLQRAILEMASVLKEIQQPPAYTEDGNALPRYLTAEEVVATALFPGLTIEKLHYYVRQGRIRAYGPGKVKTFDLRDVHEDWKNVRRSKRGNMQIRPPQKTVGRGLHKRWRTP